MKKIDALGDGIFDQHALGIAGNQFRTSCFFIIRDQNRRPLMAEVFHPDLANGPDIIAQRDGLVDDLGGPKFAGDVAQANGAPCGGRACQNLLEEAWTPPFEGQKRDPHLIQLGQVGVGRQPRVKD